MDGLDEIDTAFAAAIRGDGADVAVGDAGIDAVRLGTTAIAWRRPPSVGHETPELGIAARAVRTAAQAHAELARIAADPRLSDAAKAADSADALRKAADTMAAASADAARIIDAFEAADRTEARAPALAAGDFGAALRDYEIRTYVRGLDAEARVALVRAVASADAEAVAIAHAVARSPTGEFRAGVLGAGLAAALADAEAVADPATARMRRQARERVAWLREVTVQAAAAMPRAPRTLDDERRAAIAARAA